MASRARALNKLPTGATTLVVGTISSLDENGTPYVELPGLNAPVIAQTVVRVNEIRDLIGAMVLVHIPDGRAVPIIVGLVTDSMVARAGAPSEAVPSDSNAKRLNLVAKQELILQCGKSTIILRRDGTVIVKGVNVTSRASGKQKIQGPAVNIN